jgi:putative sigma-54 modulation protein
MQVSVRFRHMESSDALRDYAVKKMQRFKRYIDEPIEVNVILLVEKFRHIAEVTILADGFKINGCGEAEDMYTAIDGAIDKIERQIKKHRKKIKRPRYNANLKSLSLQMNVLSADGTEYQEPEVVRSERLIAKPMDVNEAIMQINSTKEEFLVFTNVRSGNINLLHKRHDGHYGLIELQM